jgi:hypothetical protein
MPRTGMAVAQKEDPMRLQRRVNGEVGRLLTLAVAVLGCEGSVISPGSNPFMPVDPTNPTNPTDPTNPVNPSMPVPPGQAAPPQFTCDPMAAPDELGLPRLSRTQLSATLQFAISQALPADATTVWNNVAATFARYPADVRTPAPGDLKGGYDRFDQAIQQTRVDAMYDLGIAVAQQMTATTARMTTMMGSCATDTSTTNDRTCLETFIGKWASRVMRYPLTAADITYYADMAGTTPVAPAAVADVIAIILNGPETLYQVEHGTNDAVATAPLSGYELAARLSFHFWQAPPDDMLWAAAQSGALLAPATYSAQVARLVASPNLRASLDEFVAQWLRLDELPPLDALNADPVFKAFAGTPLPPTSARSAMIGDVLASAAAITTGGGSASDFLADKHSYAQDSFVSSIYGVAAWNGTGAAPLLTSPKRSGLITRAAMLSTGTATTRPIHKGYLVRNAILCQQLGAPPANVNTTPPMATGNQTTRQAVTNITGSGVCSGCHTTRINPPGFITEGFDALGRERTEEKIFDAQGNVTASLPVDTSTIPAVTLGDMRMMSDPNELTQAIDETRLYHSCLARQYFRFTARRPETTNDGCMLSALETAARSGAPLTQVFSAVADAPSFKNRRFQ